jgi:hypothetical protein
MLVFSSEPETIGGDGMEVGRRMRARRLAGDVPGERVLTIARSPIHLDALTEGMSSAKAKKARARRGRYRCREVPIRDV